MNFMSWGNLLTCLCWSSCGGGQNKDENWRPSIHFSDEVDIADLFPYKSVYGVRAELTEDQTKYTTHLLRNWKSTTETLGAPAA